MTQNDVNQPEQKWFDSLQVSRYRSNSRLYVAVWVMDHKSTTTDWNSLSGYLFYKAGKGKI